MNEPVFYMMAGLPGSGKSHFAHSIMNSISTDDCVIYSSDTLREELYGNASVQTNPQYIFKLMENKTIQSLKEGKSVIYDATNIHAKNRKVLLQKLSDIQCTKRCVICATNYQECLRRNAERERTVPEYAITRMKHQWNMPQLSEGFDFIDIYDSEHDIFLDDIKPMEHIKSYEDLINVYCGPSEHTLQDFNKILQHVSRSEKTDIFKNVSEKEYIL